MMTLKDQIRNEYFDWMVDVVTGERFSSQISYKKLLMHLHSIEFRYSIRMDANRATDGVDLRNRFAYEHHNIPDADLYLDGPCTVLEMMVALSIRCEESIMDDPKFGNRTGQWFWNMIASLGLSGMIDSQYDRGAVDAIVDRFLDRKYESNGRGGLFTVKNRKRDLRTVEIWYQMCWYLDNIT